MEVALKMALRATGRRYGWQGVDGHEVGVIGLKGGYHGDTVGLVPARDGSAWLTATYRSDRWMPRIKASSTPPSTGTAAADTGSPRLPFQFRTDAWSFPLSKPRDGLLIR